MLESDKARMLGGYKAWRQEIIQPFKALKLNASQLARKD
jgi:hypothetical protein